MAHRCGLEAASSRRTETPGDARPSSLDGQEELFRFDTHNHSEIKVFEISKPTFESFLDGTTAGSSLTFRIARQIKAGIPKKRERRHYIEI